MELIGARIYFFIPDFETYIPVIEQIPWILLIPHRFVSQQSAV